MENLEELCLDMNPILKIEGIGKLRNLRELDLSYTFISDISPLYELKRIPDLIHLNDTKIPQEDLDKFYAYAKKKNKKFIGSLPS